MGLHGIKYIKRIFEHQNVCVCGLVGRGKDMLSSNVAVRLKRPYVSNVPYGGEHIPLNFQDLDIHNTYRSFIDGDITFYESPYPPDTNIFISDIGVYLPSQYCNELNRSYPYLATYMALARHIGPNNRVHLNCQNLNRCYDKIREMSDVYITCNWCKVIFGITFQIVTEYDNYNACVQRVKPMKVRRSLTGKNAHAVIDTYRDDFEQRNGRVRRHLLIYRHKSNYDTHYFNTLLKGGEKREKDS